MENEKEKRRQEVFKKEEPFIWKIPDCCREGWESCPHVPKKQKKVKTNIGL